MSQPIVIAIAVIEDDRGHLLLARRRADDHLGGLWEFPGGKVRADESIEAACERECREELGADVAIGAALLPAIIHGYPGRTVALHFLRARLRPGSPAPRALAAEELRWVAPALLLSLPAPEANRSVMEALRSQAAAP